MKKVLLSAVAILGFTFANAQEEEATTTAGFAKGDVFVSGAVTINSTKFGDDKSSQFTIAPKAGYFVTENIAVGVKLGYSSASDAQMSEFKGFDLGGSYALDYDVITGGVFGRYYFTPANQFSLFAELGIDYDLATVDEIDGVSIDDDNTVSTFGVNAGLGMNYFVSPSFSIEAGVGVLGYSTSDFDGMDDTNDAFTFGGDWTAVTFGVNYKF